MWRAILLFLDLSACGFPRPADVEAMVDGGDLGGDGGAKTCAQTTCTDSMLEVCGTSLTVDHVEQCALGCFPDGSRCIQLAPSNGLGSFLDQAARLNAITLPRGAIVDTDAGTVTSGLGAPIQVVSATVSQAGGGMLRVFVAQSLTIADIRIHGTLPVAFVSSGELRIEGTVDASAHGDLSGPGALSCDIASGGGGLPSNGFFVHPTANSGGYPQFIFIINGFGGGGFGTNGGSGGVTDSQFAVGTGGVANGNAELVPLRGGCHGGGGQGSGSTDPPLHRGAGGGAVQLVSGHAVHITSGAIVYVGGGRGVAGALGREQTTDTNPVYGPAGGGSGGGILIEAPDVVIDDGSALLAAGGGGGGYGACSPGPDGVDAPATGAIPAGGACPPGTQPASAGGAGAVTGNGMSGGSVAMDKGSAGSGGGGLGRIRINTADGLYAVSVNIVVRGVATSGMVARR